MKGSINFSLANKEKINDIISDRISNNLTEEKEGNILDATQGKILNNSIDTLNTNTSLVAGIFPFNRVIYKQIACAKENTIIVDLSEYVDSKYLRFTVCFKCEHPSNSTYDFLSLNNFKMWFEKGTGGGQYATGFYYTRCTYSNMDSPNITIGSIKRNGAVSQYELTISKNDDNTLSITNNGLYGTYVGILIIPTEFEQLTNRIDEIKDTYLPLKGGTMDKGASIIVPRGEDDRYTELAGGVTRFYLTSTTGYSGGMAWYDQSKNLLGEMGLYGSKGIPEYYFVGSYSDPFVKVDMEGNVSIKKALPVSSGGTGKTTLEDSANALINGLSTGSSTPEDNDYYVSQYAGGEKDTFHRRPVSALWEYIKGKISSVLGLTASSYSGNSATTTKWATARNINGLSVDGTANRVNYGTCSTAAATAAKTVACSGFTLVTGAEITVKFTVTNTAASPTLNVNSTGAKAIYYRGAAITAGHLAANRTYTFRYNGTQYELVGDIDTNTTYKNETAMVDLGFTKDATYTVHEFFDKLYDKGKTGNIALYFRYDNSAAAKVSDGTTTININGVSCLMFVRNKSETWAKHHAIISNKNKTYLLYAQHDGSTTPSAQGIIDLTSTVATSCTGNSTSATYASTATKAGTATYATNSGTATYSSNGAKATSATSATYASTATKAGTASYSSNGAKATSATSATYATTATKAGTATYASNIANNLTTTGSGYALDARQGKVLSDKISNIGLYQMNSITSKTTVAAESAILSTTVEAGRYLILMSVVGEGSAWYGENGSAITDITNHGYCLTPPSTMSGYDKLCFRTFTASTKIGMFNCNGASKAYNPGTKLMAIRIK